MDKENLFTILDILLKIEKEYFHSTREVFAEFLADNALFFTCNYESVLDFLHEILDKNISEVMISKGSGCYGVYSEKRVCLIIEEELVEEYKYV
jgi:hypothetical protein